MTVATVPKGVSLVQAKPNSTGAVTTVQGSPKGLPQGATIVKLVGQGQPGAKGTATLLQAGQQVQGGTVMTVGGKQQVVSTQNIGGKQTIVIARPGGQGTPVKQQGGQQVIVVSTASGVRTVQAGATVQAGQANTQTVNVLPTAGQVTTGPGGVKMIVVSQGAISQSTTSTSTTVAAGGTKTISIPAGALQKTVTLTRAGGAQGQLLTLPSGQTLVGSGQQTITLGGKPVTVQVSTAGGQKTVTLVANQGAGKFCFSIF